MTQRELEAIIGRAILDQEFRMALFANPPAALAGYELTEAEGAALRMVDAESLDACRILGGGFAWVASEFMPMVTKERMISNEARRTGVGSKTPD